MSARVRIRQDASGRPVAVKIAGRAGSDERLAHEALVLAAAAHPGVVELCGLAATDGELELRTRWVGSRSLAEAIPLPAPQVAGIMGAVADTVADLHRMGLVHGRIDATHVLLDDRGRPVLCGFSGAGGLGQAIATEPGPRAGDDVAALGELLTSTLGPVPTDGWIPDHRFRRTRTHHQLHRSLLVLADTATVDDPNARPSARALAAGIQRLVPDPVPAPSAASPLEHLRATVGPSGTRRGRRGPRAGVFAVGIVLVGLGIAVVTRPAPAPSEQREDPPVPEVLRDESPDVPIAATGSGLVEHEGRLYTVGLPGDDVAVADWRCDGRPTPALVRPDTGDAFVFESWASPGLDLVVAPAGTVARGARLVPPGPERCPDLAVVNPDGTVVTIPIPDHP